MPVDFILAVIFWAMPMILGLAAWALPLIYLTVWKRKDLFCAASLALCAASIGCQLWKIHRLAAVGEFEYIADTIGGMCLCAAVRLGVAILFNAIVLFEERSTRHE